MNSITPFEFPATGQTVRVVALDGQPYWVVADVCSVLGHSNPSMAAGRLDPDDLSVAEVIDSMGRRQQARVVNEGGLYELVIRSDRPQANAFRRWVTHDVIPSIRRTGSYAVGARFEVPASFAEALELAARQARELDIERARVAELEPRAAQADQYRAANGETAVGDFANDLKAWAAREHRITVRHKDVWDFLAEICLLIRGNTIRHNEPTAFAIEHDYVRAKRTTFPTNTRGDVTSVSPRLTQVGCGFAWDRAVRRIAEYGSLRRDAGLRAVS